MVILGDVCAHGKGISKQLNRRKKKTNVAGTYELPAMSSATVLYDSCRRSLVQHDRNFETKFLDLETMLAANFNLARLPFLGVA